MDKEKEHKSTVTLLEYTPLGEEGPLGIAKLVVPDRDFEKGQIAKWETLVTPNMVVISNLVHRDYPDVYCQVQMAPGADGNTHVFFLHAGPIEEHIPEEVVEEIFPDMAAQIMVELNRTGSPRQN